MWVRRLVIAVAAYALFAGSLAVVYAVVQHNGRNAVEDAPRQLLSSTVDPSSEPHEELARFQGVFWVRYDAGDRPIAGNGYLHGTIATVPSGVLATAREAGEDAVTWQPENGLRFAIVAEDVGHGDVMMAGASLDRTEGRADATLLYVLLGLIAGAVVVAVACAVDALVRPLVSARRTLPG
ncbi:hypothetical protein [Leifsonia sp. SIMBA_070]|uniref:hypothetical protein n=1 Tax=Leifsonia sp. SIMBA_070 TaxID=3085810 RepID=UPI00397CF7D0